MAKGFFDAQKTIMERDQRFFAAVLSIMMLMRRKRKILVGLPPNML